MPLQQYVIRMHMSALRATLFFSHPKAIPAPDTPLGQEVSPVTSLGAQKKII